MNGQPDDAVRQPMVVDKPRQDAPWWDFIGHRRQFVSDRGWFGLAFLAAGIGNLHDGQMAWLSAVAIPVGALLVGSAVRRFWQRAEQAAEAVDRRREADRD